MWKLHEMYCFEDASVALIVQETLFKLHRSILRRHSPTFFNFYSKLSTPGIFAIDNDKLVREAILTDDCPVYRLDLDIKATDFEALVSYLYLDKLLDSTATLGFVRSLSRVSKPDMCDFARVYARAMAWLDERYTPDPLLPDISTWHDLPEALSCAREFKLNDLRKRIYYAIITNDVDFGPRPEDIAASTSSQPLTNGTSQSPQPLIALPKPDSDLCTDIVLPKPDSDLCTHLMTAISEYFTPTLYQPAVASHMECTDVFGTRWMTAVVHPAFEDGGTYKPIQTLKRMMKIDWAGYGICEECVRGVRAEWEQEAKAFWEKMDEWIVASG